ncbi:BREX system P-loop protein BrxC [Bacillus salacetis]|uniref:BREX system P-loop protein BrxC n=1 Tax=Bacillus salacetis TaxID=2315464 RepID=A0A3A1R107_9BACI|nr:BREX system P-loop protein BrxC [Bacillus salacetis]RIW32679.1 BREX system P-loop protein BrxC [Bacillus salacetis]
MLLKEMFQKDIERDIKGVIKVAQTDEEHIHQELDEYVVTRELNKHLSKFYENYQKGIDGKTDKMGVWISGFFGSGKSHFLKILAYLLENKNVQGKKAIEFFQDKLQDPIILANMNRTADIETETILFNIDSKASLDSKEKNDAILRVFMKVFYEHRGYYGDIPGVAEMEKYLDNNGVLDQFKAEFKALAGEEWVDRRNTFYFDEDYVVGALTKVTDMSEATARNWFENGVNNFEISIEKFAKDVKEYIKQKGNNFHLVFLVDEIGQFIGDSRNLMLNLQTVAEDLGTHCDGKVWIMVTSQESIDSIVKVKGDDFSRIQGRFDTRLSLSSISVDEVIKKRILLKKDFVSDKLRLLYPEKSAILKNLISFKEQTADLRGYDDADEFANVYPFIPYQFKLLQNVFEQVRKHGSSGKHLSEGERSMLSAFKEAGLQYKDADEGTLIPFYAFYDTIKEFLNPSISRVIEGAYENPVLKDDSFNMNLLKVLFMIKYIKELPANMDNIATLMVTHIDEDKLELKEKLKISLRKLISQTLIQKNGDYYIFLTDDEQDINREIKSMNVDEEMVKRELANYIFQDLYDDKKFRYSSQYSFSYNQKMDDKNYGNQTSAVGIHILSPLSDHYEKSEQQLLMMTSGTSEMLVKLGASDLYVEEMEEVLKIEEYRKKKNITQLPENIQNILNNKQVEVRERRRRIRELLEDAIKGSIFYINGDRADVKGSTVKEKLNTALKGLVDNVYTKLGYVADFLESERELIPILSYQNEQLTLDTGESKSRNIRAIKEMEEFIKLQADINKQVRVKILLDRFSDKPYGWRALEIAGMIALLLKEQKIRIRFNAEYLEPEVNTNTIVTVLTKSTDADKAIIIKRIKVDEQLIQTAKRICRELFNKSDLADDEDGLVKDIRALIEKQIAEIIALKDRYEGRKYPGMSLLDKGLEYFEVFNKGLDNASFFIKLKEMEDDLLDWEEDIIYVKSFFENQKDIFDKGLYALKKYDENKAYLSSDDSQEALKKLQSILTDPIPYRKIKEIPELVNQIEENIGSVLNEKKANAKEKIKVDQDYLVLLAKQYGVNPATKEKVEAYYNDLQASVDTFKDIYKVDATISQSASFKEKYERVIDNEIKEWQRRKEQEKAPIGRETGETETSTTPVTTIQKEKVKVTQVLNIRTLTSEEDVDQFVNTLSTKLKQIIKSNKHIEFID